MGTVVKQCETCDGRDEAMFMEDGQCRECQGVERLRQPRVNPRVSADEYVRNQTYYDHIDLIEGGGKR